MSTSPFSEQIKQRYERNPLPFHLTGWIVYIALPYQLVSVPHYFSEDEILKLVGVNVLNDTLNISFFYLNYYIITPNVVKKRRSQLLWVSLGGMSVLLTLVNVLGYYFLLKPVYALSGTPMSSLIRSLLSLILLAILSSGWAVYKKRNKLVVEHRQMIIDKEDAEPNALKLHISPHFLFDTLNNLRWLARQKSDRTEDAIQDLSDMLRYMVYQVNRGTVLLGMEIDYLSDYVALQQLRLSPNIRVDFDKDIDNDNALIEPLLLIHFVENAFKHGIHHKQASVVTIRLYKQENTLLFSTRNRLVRTGPKASSGDSGIGIKNVKRRLALHYPNRHSRRVFQKEDLFCVDLHIDLEAIPHQVALSNLLLYNG